ncbi:MAG: hypothetical protein WC623_10275 [Pedobacter sp.]|uniref:hypothetical protein n=1 Tax=Pedobacter sp. TaxID=1411316 RepID=UPI003564FFE0
MKLTISLCTTVAFLFASCNDSPHKTTKTKAEHINKEVSKLRSIKKGDSLVYESPSFSSYTEKVKRGTGIISFYLDVNDRLDIWNMDNTKFGNIVLKKDLTYLTLNMPRKVIARKLVPEYEFAAFDFDAENLETDEKFIIIYINKAKRKVKKSGAKFVFASRN